MFTFKHCTLIGVVCLGAFVMISCGEFAPSNHRDRSVRMRRDRFDWQIPEPTKHPTTTTTTSPTTTTTEPMMVVEKINVTSMLIRDGTIQINADDVMHKEEAEGIGDVGLILWGGPSKKSLKHKKISATTTTTSTTKSNIAKIMDAMPSANEDVIRVVKLADDEHYGKGRAKPKYISMVLATMNSTEYKDETSSTTTIASTSSSQANNEIPTTQSNNISNTKTNKATTENNNVVMKISKTSHTEKSEKTTPAAFANLVDISGKESPNESSTPIIMGEHMEYTISVSS